MSAPPVTYIAKGEFTSPPFCKAFAAGCGGPLTEQQTLGDGDVALFGSPKLWPMLQEAIQQERSWFYGDHGYFGRGTHYRVTRNAYQHYGDGETTGERFRAFGREVQPWRKDGRHVLVCPNSAIYFELILHGSVKKWLEQVTAELRLHTDREIRIRWKPKKGEPGIAVDLTKCWAVVVFTSTAAIDALVAGIPVFVLSTMAASYQMGLDDLAQIEQPFYPDDRERFFGVLADQQWTLPEIQRGDAWKALQ